MPGRKDKIASMPSPPNGSISAKRDAHLLFQGAYRATKHDVWFGFENSNMQRIADLLCFMEMRMWCGFQIFCKHVHRLFFKHSCVDGYGFGNDDKLVRAGQDWHFQMEDKMSC